MACPPWPEGLLASFRVPTHLNSGNRVTLAVGGLGVLDLCSLSFSEKSLIFMFFLFESQSCFISFLFSFWRWWVESHQGLGTCSLVCVWGWIPLHTE